VSVRIPITKGKSPIKTFKRWEPERSALGDACWDAAYGKAKARDQVRGRFGKIRGRKR